MMGIARFLLDRGAVVVTGSHSHRQALAPTSLLMGLGLLVLAAAFATHVAKSLPAVTVSPPPEDIGLPIPGAQAVSVIRGVARFDLSETEALVNVLIVSVFGRPESLTPVVCLPVSVDESLTEQRPVWRRQPSNDVSSLTWAHPDPRDDRIVQSSPERPLSTWLLPQSTGAIRIEARPWIRCGRVRLDWDVRTPITAADEAWGRAVSERMARDWLPAVETRLGRCSHATDADDLVVVITPAVATIAQSVEPIEACVLPRDYEPSTSRLTETIGGVIYLHPQLSPERQPPILVHELAHVATLCRLRERYGSDPWPLQDWSSEGLAHAVELAVTGDRQNVGLRLEAFAELPERSPLVVCDGRQSRRWRDPRCRGAACSFFVWASETYGLPRVAEAVYATGQTDDPWAAALGTSWGELYRQWTIDNARHNRVAMRMATTATIELEGTATTYLQLPHGGRWEVRVPTDREVTVTIVQGPRGERAAPRH